MRRRIFNSEQLHTLPARSYIDSGDPVTSGASRLGPGGTGPPNLAQPPPPTFLIGSIVISLSRCCLKSSQVK